MASGSFTGTTSNNYITARVLWTSTSKPEVNKSDITVTLQVKKSSASSGTTYGTGAWTVLINGTTYDFSAKVSIPPNNTYVTIYTKTVKDIEHNPDGTKSVVLGWTGGISGTSYTATYISNTTVTLDAIPRASTVSSFSFTNGYIEQGIDLTISSKVSSYYHDIHMYLPDTSGTGIVLVNATSGRKASGTHHINLTSEQLSIIYRAMPSKTSSQFTIYVKTYTNATSSTEIGDWQTKTTIGNISDSVKPTISSLSATLNSGGLSGLYVQGKSTTKLTCGVTAGNGATVTSYVFSGPNLSSTSATNTATSGTITSSGTLTYTVTVTDSRGRKASTTTQIYVYPYSIPNFKSTSANRSNSAGTLDSAGTYAKYTAEGTYSSVGGKNTRTITMAHSSDGGNTYSAETTVQASTNLNASVSGVYGSGNLSATTSYKIRFTIKDSYGATATSILTLSTVSRAINIKSDNNGIAFGKIAEGNGIETPWDITFKGSGEKALIFENGSSSAWQTKIYKGSSTSPTALGIWDDTNNRSVFRYNTSGDVFIDRPTFIDGSRVVGEREGTARLLTNVFAKNLRSSYTGYIGVRLGKTTLSLSSMITIKGHITSYQNSTSFEASCYYYNMNGVFYSPIITATNPINLKEAYFAENISDGCVYLILGAPDSVWYYPTIVIESVSIGYTSADSEAWMSGWTADIYTNLTSKFTNLTSCQRGETKKTLWSGAVKNGATITVNESIRNFRFLTCIIGEETTDLGIVLGTFLDDTLPQLHFGAIFTETNGLAGNDLMGAKFKLNSETSLTLDGCGSKFASTLHCKKIVGWR